MTTKECQIVHCDNKLKSVKLYTVFVLYSPFCLQLFTARRVEIFVDNFSVFCLGVFSPIMSVFTSVSASATLVRGSRFSSVSHLDYRGCVAKIPKMSDMLQA